MIAIVPLTMKLLRHFYENWISFLFLAFLFMLITLILLSTTIKYDLFEYRYNLNYRLIEQSLFEIK